MIKVCVYKIEYATYPYLCSRRCSDNSGWEACPPVLQRNVVHIAWVFKHRNTFSYMKSMRLLEDEYKSLQILLLEINKYQTSTPQPKKEYI